MEGTPARVVIGDPDACIACGACIVQCPEDALYFRFTDGRVVEPSTIRRTRLDLLGERSVRLLRRRGHRKKPTTYFAAVNSTTRPSIDLMTRAGTNFCTRAPRYMPAAPPRPNSAPSAQSGATFMSG